MCHKSFETMQGVGCVVLDTVECYEKSKSIVFLGFDRSSFGHWGTLEYPY